MSAPTKQITLLGSLSSWWNKWTSLATWTRTYILNTALLSSLDIINNMFLSIFLWKISNSIILICYYSIVKYLATPVFSILGGVIARHRDRASTFRLGIYTYLLLLLLVLFLRERCVDLFILLAIVHGIGDGLYWAGRQTMDFENAENHNSGFVLGTQVSLIGLVSMLTPILSGLIVDKTPKLDITGEQTGYILLFLVATFIALAGVFISRSFKLDAKQSHLDLKTVLFPFMKNPRYLPVLIKILLTSLRYTAIFILGPILVSAYFVSGTGVGSVYSTGAVLSIIFGALIGVILTRENRMGFNLMGMLMTLLSCLFLLFSGSWWALALFIILQRLGAESSYYSTQTVRYEIIRTDHNHKRLNVEYGISVEPWVMIGRIIGFVSIILFIGFLNEKGINQVIGLKYALLAVSLFVIPEYILLLIADRSLKNRKVRNRLDRACILGHCRDSGNFPYGHFSPLCWNGNVRACSVVGVRVAFSRQSEDEWISSKGLYGTHLLSWLAGNRILPAAFSRQEIRVCAQYHEPRPYPHR